MVYQGRRLPLNVVAGRPGEPPPFYVSHLSEARIILTKRSLSPGAAEDRQEIAFVERGKPWENDDLYFKLFGINLRGIPFQFQPKEMEAPCSLMAWWQEVGKLEVSFKAISWRSPDEWYITTIEPPAIGVRGWTGPKPFGA